MEKPRHPLETFFSPRAVAVVGASRDPHAIGNKIFKALIDCGYRGVLYPVNPAATEIHGWTAFPSVSALPEGVELAVIAVPAARVPAVVEECHARHIPSLVVISAGFAEVGANGRSMQDELLWRVRRYGMRVVGPNCFGVVNADAKAPLNASFSPVFPLPGSVAMASQSGALGLSVLGMSRARGLGLSKFVSMGNKMDLSSNDLLEYWEQDPQTRTILLYLESFGNPQRFAGIARRVGKQKPIIAVKSGRTASGGRAAGSHTAALMSNDTAVTALFHQTGVIRADTVEEMFDVATAIEWQPLPRGRRVGILTNAGGPAILCADACETEGLKVAELSEGLQRRLRGFLSPDASVRNPVDMVAAASPQQYSKAIECLMQSGEIDSLVVLYALLEKEIPPELYPGIGDGVIAGRKGSGAAVPVVFCLMAPSADRQPLVLRDETIPSYAFPEHPARALAQIARYAEWRRQPAPVAAAHPPVDETRARQICSRFLETAHEGWLPPEPTRELLKLFSLPVPPAGTASTAKEAGNIARKIGFPVALKLVSRTLVHKTEVGGVKLGLRSEPEVEAAFVEIQEGLRRVGKGNAMEGVLVQPMLEGGVELMMGVSRDPVFGPVIAFGLGGIYVEVLSDVAFRIAPLTRLDAEEMVRQIKGYPLLRGYRGHRAADEKAVIETLLALSLLAERVPQIAEVDLNPVFAFAPGKGCAIADVRIRVKR